MGKKEKRSRKDRRMARRAVLKEQIQEHRALFFVYLIMRILVIASLVLEIIAGNFTGIFYCVLTLVLFMIPSFVERRIKIDVPDTLEIIILVFIFAAEILGELREYYINVPMWDAVLHTTNGFLCAAIGLALIDILNRSDRVAMNLSPLFVALVAFCFSMTIGVIWEFFEFGMDYFFHSDMQKDTVLTSITSVMLNPEGRNHAVTLPIESIVINGEAWNYGGYIDIGLYDTMKDLFVNFIGAVVCSTLGFFYVRSKGKRNRVLKRLMLTRIEQKTAKDPTAEQNAEAKTE